MLVQLAVRRLIKFCSYYIHHTAQVLCNEFGDQIYNDDPFDITMTITQLYARWLIYFCLRQVYIGGERKLCRAPRYYRDCRNMRGMEIKCAVGRYQLIDLYSPIYRHCEEVC